MDKLFIDTDVVLDFLLERKPFSDAASALFTLGDSGIIQLYTSGLVYSNCYYLLRKFFSHQSVMVKLKSLASFVKFVSVDQFAVQEALNSSFNDFEDALQNAAASRSGIIKLITRNSKGYKQSTLSVMTAEEYLASRS